MQNLLIAYVSDINLYLPTTMGPTDYMSLRHNIHIFRLEIALRTWALKGFSLRARRCCLMLSSSIVGAQSYFSLYGLCIICKNET